MPLCVRVERAISHCSNLPPGERLWPCHYEHRIERPVSHSCLFCIPFCRKDEIHLEMGSGWRARRFETFVVLDLPKKEESETRMLCLLFKL
jgi:hypothetical protein